MKGLNLAGVDNAQVVQLRIIQVLEKHNTNVTTTSQGDIYCKSKAIPKQMKYLEEGEILVAIEDKDGQVVVHVEYLRLRINSLIF